MENGVREMLEKMTLNEKAAFDWFREEIGQVCRTYQIEINPGEKEKYE